MANKSGKKKNIDLPRNPFIRGGTMYVPVDENIGGAAAMSPEEFMRQSHKLSDKELNRILYGQAKALVEAGAMPEWPEDDFGIVFWFTWNFITPEMREVFPAIAREYLSHEPMIGTDFVDIPYPMMNEVTWDDAYYFRVISMMLAAARKGSSYSRNFLLSLYKVYYKQEYNRLKGKNKITWLDVLELHDEDCKRKGLTSGHALDGDFSYREKIIEQRKHEAGWTNVYGLRRLDPAPKKPTRELREDEKYGEELSIASDVIRGMNEALDEPPLQPTASRVFIMAELMRIPIDETCNGEASNMNISTESFLKLDFMTSPEIRHLREELIDRYEEFMLASEPELAEPFRYQKDPKFLPLELSEYIMFSTFRNMDRNVRMPYDSREFKLSRLLADLSMVMDDDFPDLQMSWSDMLFLAMIQYLSECLVDMMVTRDTQLDEVLHFHRRYAKGERNEKAEESKKNIRADKVMKTVAGLREEFPVEPAPKVSKAPQTEEELKEELENLRAELEERDLALAEAEQKIIRQRALYEKAHERELEQEKQLSSAGTEHAELIALREYVYSLKDETEIELDEESRQQMVAQLQNKNVAILGGTERWIKRMKKMFPNWKIIGVEDTSIGAYNALESADFIYIYTNALKHEQYYKAMNMIKRKGKMLFYLGSTNTEENIVRFYRDLCR